jgi:hypothetical protein
MTNGYVPAIGERDINKIIRAVRNLYEATPLPFGQCRLTKSGANLLLSQYGGKSLFIDGSGRDIPAAGLTLPATGLTPSTTYYIYATYSGSDVSALEASTTTHATDSTYGNEVKSGDTTRALVGVARVITGPAWADTSTQRFVLSWHNRRNIYGLSNFTTDRSTSSLTYVELNTEIRCEWLTWGDEAVFFGVSGAAFNDGTGGAAQRTDVSLGVDSTTTAEDTFAAMFGTNTSMVGLSHAGLYAEGYHFSTVLGRGNGGVNHYFSSANSAGNRFTQKVMVRG